MANEAGLKIVVGSDISGAINGLNQVTAAAGKAGTTIDASFNSASLSAVTLANSLESTSQSFDEVAASGAALARINSQIDAAAQSALNASSAFEDLSNEVKSIPAVDIKISVGRAPLADIEAYKASVRSLKQDLSTGLVPKVSLASIDQLEAKLDAITKNIRSTSDPVAIVKLRNEALKAQTALTALNKSAGLAGTGIGGLNRTSDASTQALINFGRVVQDAPFGLLGISNNINPLAESFSRLRKETGSAGGALKALAGSLVGVGGLGLALSAVTFVAAGGIDTIRKFFAQFGDANSKITEAKKFLEELRSAMDIRLDAGGSVAGEIAQIEALISVVKDETLAKRDRMQAISELQRINKSYFGDLSLEKSSLDGLTQAQEEYTKAIIAQAEVKGFSEEITKASTELRKAKRELNDYGQAARDAQKILDDYVRRRAVRGLDENAQRALDLQISRNRNLVNSATEAYRQQDAIVRQLTAATGQLEQELNTSVQNQIKLKSLTTDRTQTTGRKEDPVLKALKLELQGYQAELVKTNKLREAGVLPIYRENDALENQLKIFETLRRIDAREVAIGVKPKLEIDAELDELDIKKAMDTAFVRMGSVPVDIAVIPKLKIDTAIAISRNFIPEGAFDDVIQALEKQAKAAQDRLSRIAVDLTEGVNSAFQGAAEALGAGIGDILSGLGAGTLVAGFANVLADLLSQVGKMMITTGVKILGLQKLIAKIATTPAGAAAAIAGGVAAIALAQLLRNSVRDIKPRPFATGGIVAGPTVGLIGEAGPEVVLPLDRLPGLLNATGNSNINITGSLGIRGRELVVFLERERNANQRVNR